MSVNGIIFFKCGGETCDIKQQCERYKSYMNEDQNPQFAEPPLKDNGKCHFLVTEGMKREYLNNIGG